MLRLPAIIALLFAVFALTNASSAQVSETGHGGVVFQDSIIAVPEAGPSTCCHKEEAASERPSACKSDCKAVIAAAPPASPDTPPYHSRPVPTAETLYKAAVDLRPPIS